MPRILLEVAAVLAILSRVPGALAATAHAQPAALTTAAAVHDLPAEEAARKLPVHLRATVTYYDASQNTLFVADKTGAVFVKTSHPYAVKPGDLIEIDGKTAKSFRTTVGLDPTIWVVGRGTMPHTTIQTDENYGELMGGRWDCQLVTMHGRVRSVIPVTIAGRQILEIELRLNGGLVQAYVQHWDGLDLSSLIDADIEMTGVVGGWFNAKWQLMHIVLYTWDSSGVRVAHRPSAAEAGSGALTSIDNLMQTRIIEDRSRRVQVRGSVTYYRPGQSLVIQQGQSSVSASTRYDGPLERGSVVVLSGFAEPATYVPSLGEVEVWPTGEHESVRPIPASYTDAMTGRRSEDLISMEGTLLTEQHTLASDMLFLKVEQHTVPVALTRMEGAGPLEEIAVGSRVRVNGICRIDARWATGAPGASAQLFHLDMGSPEDVVVLAPPSWWTVRHLAMLLSALLLGALAVAGWAFVLRVRVARQKRAIEQAIRLERERSRLLELVSSSTPLAELLGAICGMVSEFAPGLQCWCMLEQLRAVHLHAEDEHADGVQILGQPAACILASVPLFDRIAEAGPGGSPTLMPAGTFYVGAATKRVPNTFEREVISAASGLTALAIQQRRMYEELQYRSLHDGLTQLANRRCADQQLDAALAEVRAHGGSLLVAFVDINGFKQVNDRHGHKIGDLYLQEIAMRLGRQKRRGDLLARMGGDEFLLVARGRTPVDPSVYRQRVEAAFAEPFFLDGVRVDGSASVGVALFPLHGETVADLQRYADTEMYEIKRGTKAAVAGTEGESAHAGHLREEPVSGVGQSWVAAAPA